MDLRNAFLKKALPVSLACLALTGLGWVDRSTGQIVSFYEEQAYWEEHFRQMPDVHVKGSGWKPYHRWAWFYGPRVEADGFIPTGARWNAYLQQQEMLRQAGQQGPRTSPVWTSLGPTNIAGRCQPIAIDPIDPSRMYVGAVSGGLWISTNAGASWEPADDQLPTLAVGAIAIDPNDHNTILIGTGEGNNSADAVFGVGVMRSTDAGLTWSIYGSGLNWNIGDGKAVNCLSINPSTGTVIAATNAGTWRLSGGTWTSTNSGTGTGLVRHPGSPDIVYLANGRTGGSALNGVYQSTDDGQTWTEQTNGFPATHGRLGLALCTSQPSILYAGVSATNGSMLGIYKTTDSGATWTLANSSPNHYGSQGWYDLVIAVDPTNPDNVYSGGIDIWVSTDGATSFTHVTHWNYPPGAPQYVHADQHGWAFHPNDASHVYAACDGGIFQSMDGGLNWAEISTGLTSMQFYDIEVAQSDPSRALGGTQDNGTNHYLGTGDWDRHLGGDGFHCNIDYAKPDTMFQEVYYGDHYRTLNGGLTFIRRMSGITEDGDWDTPVHMDYGNTAILYTAHQKIYKTTNRGDAWVAKTAILPGRGTTIAQCPGDNNYLYVGMSSVRNIRLSTDRGETWTQCAATGLPSRSITRLRVHPTDPATVYATYSGFATPNVWKSTDYGANWSAIAGNIPALPVNAIEIDPNDPNVIYVGTDLGVWRTEDGGLNWLPYGTGLPNVVVADLRIRKVERILTAGTYGRGMWEVPLTVGSSAVQESGTPVGDLAILDLFPNPVGPGNTTVRFNLPSAGRVRVQLFDVSGRLIETSFDGPLAAGIHRVEWPSRAPNGIYFVRVRDNNLAVSRKLTIQR